MHLHLHLKQTYLDFGQPHATWCYAFERFNSVLGSYFTNNKTIEPQIMRKFTQHQMILNSDYANNADLDIFPFYKQQNKIESIGNTLYLLRFTTNPLSELTSFAVTDDDAKAISSLPPLFEDIMTTEQVNELQLIYEQLYPLKTFKKLSATVFKFGRLLLAGDLVGSNMPGRNSHASSVIMAYWPSKRSSLKDIDYSRKQVGVVQYFLKHKVSYTEDDMCMEHQHIFAYVKWKETHEQYNWYGISAAVCHDSFEVPAACCFIPVQRFYCRCGYKVMPVKFNEMTENVFIACPISFKYYL